MFQGLFDTNAFFDLTVKTFAPLARASEISARAFEKAAKFQVDSAIELVNHSAALLQLTAQSRGPLELVSKQTELNAKFVEARTAKFQEYLKFTSDLQGDVTKWAEEAKTTITTPFRQAA